MERQLLWILWQNIQKMTPDELQKLHDDEPEGFLSILGLIEQEWERT